MAPQRFAAAALVLTCVVCVCTPVRIVDAQQAPARDAADEGKRVFKRANCAGCHKWHGNGGGGYGGDALSLRKTVMTREQIIEVVRCGRPGTGMPFHLRGAYDAEPCYQLRREQLTGMMPPEAASFLRASEIEAVSDYVLAHVKGKGEPDYADCIAFFGEGSRVCDIYKTAQPNTGRTSDSAPGKEN
jgi:mono/diheme cytochrome c family protein